ncbi:hypothetical protein GCM10012320_03540 [Sinomonas cellulolyticus]|nr:hypothetical protein GCM10012320_03540 [Sinomonas sp. KCTC 49339]
MSSGVWIASGSSAGGSIGTGLGTDSARVRGGRGAREDGSWSAAADWSPAAGLESAAGAA